MFIDFLFVCLFVWRLSSHSRIFHSYRDVTHAVEGLQILTNARHPWPLSSEGSLTYHTHYDTGLPFIMVISEDPWHSHWAFGSGTVTTSFYDSGLSRPGIESRSPACEANALPLRHRGGHLWFEVPHLPWQLFVLGFHLSSPTIQLNQQFDH